MTLGKLNIVYVVSCVFLALTCSSASKYNDIKEEVLAYTDQQQYLLGDTISITIQNNLSTIIYTHFGSYTPLFTIKQIEKKENDKWQVYYAMCQLDNCIYDSDVPVALPSKEQISIKWLPRLYSIKDEFPVNTEPGVYRILVEFLDNNKTKWNQIYTNEFNLK